MNYDRLMEETIAKIPEGVFPRLLLHSCCAPCSSAVLERLRTRFRITVFYYDPNIMPRREYDCRAEEVRRLVRYFNSLDDGAQRIEELAAPYDPERWLEAVRGLEDCPEGGERCAVCFRLRLALAAEEAARGGYDLFTTTLTISPLKDAQLLNRIGMEEAGRCGTVFLPSDFKKKNGYRRSVELSGELGLYRQDYCGCAFSKAERERRRQKANME